jgi:uncharacterized coiled-coil protein SlyX
MDPTRARAPEIADLATARALITALQEQLATSQQEVQSLRHQLDVLCQRLFGKKSERVDPRQLQLALEQLANEPGPVTEPIEMDSGETPVREHARRAAAWRSTWRRRTRPVHADTRAHASARPSRRSWSTSPRVSSSLRPPGPNMRARSRVMP